jgi:hypothetical protein
MSFYMMLPLLRGWSYHYIRYPQTGFGILPRGADQLITEISGPGYMLFAAARLWNSGDGKYVEVRADFDFPDWTYPIHFSADGLQAFGDTRPINYGAYATIIDDTNLIYAAALTPANPLPFRKNLKISLVAPPQPIVDNNPIYYTIVYGYVLVRDVEEFKESLMEVFGIEDVVASIRELTNQLSLLNEQLRRTPQLARAVR